MTGERKQTSRCDSTTPLRPVAGTVPGTVELDWTALPLPLPCPALPRPASPAPVPLTEPTTYTRTSTCLSVCLSVPPLCARWVALCSQLQRSGAAAGHVPAHSHWSSPCPDPQQQPSSLSRFYLSHLVIYDGESSAPSARRVFRRPRTHTYALRRSCGRFDAASTCSSKSWARPAD